MGRRSRRADGSGRQAVADQHTRADQERRRRLAGLAVAGLLAVATVAVVAVALAGGGDGGGGILGGGPDLAHVHGLGVNPKDEALYIATHTGLFRAGSGETKPSRVGESQQDVMGFTIVGSDRFLGSGHPGPLQGGPSNLGLIRSDDGGREWDSVSLLGESDFHVLRSRGSMVYGFDASNSRFMVSHDGGRQWQERATPGAMLDLAIHPAEPSRVIASTEAGLVASADAGRRWRTLRKDALVLLTWPQADALYSIDGSGRVSLSRDEGRAWKAAGSIGDQPAAFASHAQDLYVALPDATIKRSADGGRAWSARAAP